jgi:hypothetical protein
MLIAGGIHSHVDSMVSYKPPFIFQNKESMLINHYIQIAVFWVDIGVSEEYADPIFKVEFCKLGNWFTEHGDP